MSKIVCLIFRYSLLPTTWRRRQYRRCCSEDLLLNKKKIILNGCDLSTEQNTCVVFCRKMKFWSITIYTEQKIRATSLSFSMFAVVLRVRGRTLPRRRSTLQLLSFPLISVFYPPNLSARKHLKHQWRFAFLCFTDNHVMKCFFRWRQIVLLQWHLYWICIRQVQQCDLPLTKKHLITWLSVKHKRAKR